MNVKNVEGVGILVRDQRKQRGWSQGELAEKVGVSRVWIGQLENGKESVEAGLMLRTLHALGLALEVSLRKRIEFEFGNEAP